MRSNLPGAMGIRRASTPMIMIDGDYEHQDLSKDKQHCLLSRIFQLVQPQPLQPVPKLKCTELTLFHKGPRGPKTKNRPQLDFRRVCQRLPSLSSCRLAKAIDDKRSLRRSKAVV